MLKSPIAELLFLDNTSLIMMAERQLGVSLSPLGHNQT